MFFSLSRKPMEYLDGYFSTNRIILIRKDLRRFMSFEINNRRYTGCKAKLVKWIKDIIKKHCKECDSFCDIFAGTGVVTAGVIDNYKTFFINDFLYSNEIIYKAFFMKMNYSEAKLYNYYSRFNSLNSDELAPNYVSENYGGKYFSFDDAKKIGEIRETIEREKENLNEKEYSILIASLLYSCDRSSNTCGHYDAYIKKSYIRSNFKFELINPIISKENDSRDITISRKDSNELSKQIMCDIVYIDPPYSSRQYSRFYHVLENITKWDKPKLYGTAMKPEEENMSEYCKTKALDSFKDLIYSLNCKYIVVSYNNTYDSKSNSSKNKMTLEDINAVLNNKGKTTIYRKSYKAFNAGKTDMNNHEEIIFITEVNL